jgi:hypothetical protein
MNYDELEKRIKALSLEVEEISKTLSNLKINVEDKKMLFQQAKEIENTISKFITIKIPVPSELKQFKIDLISKIDALETIERIHTDFLSIGKYFTMNQNYYNKEFTNKKSCESKLIGDKVKSVRIFDIEYKVQRWRDIIVILCEQLFRLHESDFDKIYEIRGTKKKYFSEDKNDFVQPALIKNANIYCETKFSAKDHVKMCKKILVLFGYDESQIQVICE